MTLQQSSNGEEDALSGVLPPEEEAPTPILDGGQPSVETPPAPEDLTLKVARLEGMLEGLTKVAPQAPASLAQPKLTAEVMENFSEEQWEQIEAKTGKSRQDILNLQRNQELKTQNNSIQARLNLNDAIDTASATNKDVPKLKKFIVEYFSDLSPEEQLDPVKLEKHMKKAEAYARGRFMQQYPNSARKVAAPVHTGRAPSPNADGGEKSTAAYEEGEVEDGSYQFKEGARVDIKRPANWKNIQSKSRGPNDVELSVKTENAPRFAGRD